MIPTYTNVKGFLKLIKKLKEESFYIVVVDNKPNEEKQKYCLDENIIYLPQACNTGFAKAVNTGARGAKSEWILILNDDVTIKDMEMVGKLVEFAKKKGYSSVSPVLKNKTGVIENIGYNVLPIGRVELNFAKKKFDQNYIDGLTAACLLIKRKVFEDMNGFDERFFAYLEDVDLFLRIKKAGYKFGVNTDIDVIHDKNTTSSKMGSFKQRQDLKNWILVIAKNWDGATLLKYLPFIIIERLRNLSGLVKANWKS